MDDVRHALQLFKCPFICEDWQISFFLFLQTFYSPKWNVRWIELMTGTGYYIIYKADIYRYETSRNVML
jgi:hypothetical protein